MRYNKPVTVFAIAATVLSGVIASPAFAEMTGHPGLPSYLCVYTNHGTGQTKTLSINFSDPKENDWLVLGDEFLNRLNITGLPSPLPGDAIMVGTIRIIKSSGVYISASTFVTADGAQVSGTRDIIETGKCREVK